MRSHLYRTTEIARSFIQLVFRELFLVVQRLAVVNLPPQATVRTYGVRILVYQGKSKDLGPFSSSDQIGVWSSELGHSVVPSVPHCYAAVPSSRNLATKYSCGRFRVVPAHPELVDAFRSVSHRSPSDKVFTGHGGKRLSTRTATRWTAEGITKA